MKRLIGLIMVFTMLVSVVACGNQGAKENSAPERTEAVTVEDS